MNAMARDIAGKALDETIDHEAGTVAVSSGPAGMDQMPTTTPQGQNRYVFSSGARPLEGYTIKRAIGRGGFGEVYYATSDAGKEVALKLITRNADVERRGVMQCMNLKSPNLITIYDLKTSEAGDTFVIMEYVAGASLANVLRQYPKGMPLAEVKTWLKGMVEGVAYLHDHGIVHRDLKPANMFLEQGTVKIGDYGLSKLITQSQGDGHSESIGTCHYMAPEISTGKYHKPIDIYAMGIILFEMLTGRVPFDGESVGEVLMKHLTARPDLSELTEPYKSIVARALAKDPAHRQVNAYDLLPPSDAPKTPNVRFIGEKNPPAESGSKNGDEEVLRIGMEEPVYYIGPETRPPVRRATWGQRFWGTGPAAYGAQPRPVVNRPARAPRQAPQPQVRRVAPQPPPAPPALPALPSTRVRVAELASSMLLAAPVAALLTIPAYGLNGVDLARQPELIAYLFGLTLLGSWGVMIPNKIWEGRKVDTTTRRLGYMLVGLLLGLAGMLLGQWTGLRLTPAFRPDGPVRELVKFTGSLDHPNLLGYLTYFGVLFGLNGWWKVTARGRRSRFRIWPVMKAGFIALLLGAVWPFPQPWGLTIAALVALVTQIVSPWSEPAAYYYRATKQMAA